MFAGHVTSLSLISVHPQKDMIDYWSRQGPAKVLPAAEVLSTLNRQTLCWSSSSWSEVDSTFPRITDVQAAIENLPEKGSIYIDFPHNIDIVFANYNWNGTALLRLAVYAYPDTGITISNASIKNAYLKWLQSCTTDIEGKVGNSYGQISVRTSFGIVIARVEALNQDDLKKWLGETGFFGWINQFGARYRFESRIPLTGYRTIGATPFNKRQSLVALKDLRPFMSRYATQTYLVEQCLYDLKTPSDAKEDCLWSVKSKLNDWCIEAPWGCIKGRPLLEEW